MLQVSVRFCSRAGFACRGKRGSSRSVVFSPNLPRYWEKESHANPAALQDFNGPSANGFSDQL